MENFIELLKGNQVTTAIVLAVLILLTIILVSFIKKHKSIFIGISIFIIVVFFLIIAGNIFQTYFPEYFNIIIITICILVFALFILFSVLHSYMH